MRFCSRRFLAVLCVLTSLLLFQAVLSAATYYVSASGNDANDGMSPGLAWRTVNKVNSVNFAGGDRILFAAGQTFSGTLYFDASDKDTAANRILVSSYGTGRATINGGTVGGFMAYNVAGITINNLNFTGAGATVNRKDGISFFTDLPGGVKLAGITVSACDVSGFGNCGINIGSWNGQTGYRVANVSVHHNLQAGLGTYAQLPNTHQNIYVGHVRAFNNPGNPNAGRNTGNGIVIGATVGAIVERCVAYNNGQNNFAPSEGPVGIWAYDSSNVTIQFNESYSNHTGSGRDGGGFDLDINVKNSVLQYNYSHDNDGAGYLLCMDAANAGNVIRYNISQNDGRKNGYAGIQTYGNINGAEIHNNTVYVTQTTGSPRAIYVAGGASNLHFRNNILYAVGGARLLEVAGGQNGIVFQGNSYYSLNGAFSIVYSGASYGTLDAFAKATSHEQSNGVRTGISTAPKLNNPGGGGTLNNADNLSTLSAYKLQSGSPLVDRGVNLSAAGINAGPRDFYGGSTYQGNGNDIGAHETSVYAGAYAPVGSTPPTSTTPDPTGKSKIFFQHTDGRLACWFMDGTNYNGAKLIRNGVSAGSGWSARSAADINADSSTDLIFQFTDSRVAAWKLQGTSYLGAAALASGLSPGRGWRLVTVADFNADGQKDLLFQNAAGQLAMWFMNGTDVTKGILLRNGQSPGSAWSAVGARDFNGDGSNDILFYNSNGALMVWIMNNSTFVSTRALRNGLAPSAGWHCAAIADLDASGDIDLIWQNADGRLTAWKFNGTSFVRSTALRNGQKAASGWRVFSSN